MRPTRGERNNNPGNIRDGQRWQGESGMDSDKAFEEFASPEDGIRALGKVLLTYQRKHGLRSVKQIVNRWAPPNENDTGAYVYSVAAALVVHPTEPLDLEDRNVLCKLVRAIIKHENGRVLYADAVIAEGVERALT